MRSLTSFVCIMFLLLGSVSPTKAQLMQKLAGATNFSVLNFLLTLTELIPTMNTTLSGGNNLTIFAPGNEAFNVLNNTPVVKCLTSSPPGIELLRVFMSYHVALGRFPSPKDGQQIMTLSGFNLTVEVNRSGLFAAGQKVVAPRAVTDRQGVVHGLNRILVPPKGLEMVIEVCGGVPPQVPAASPPGPGDLDPDLTPGDSRASSRKQVVLLASGLPAAFVVSLSAVVLVFFFCHRKQRTDSKLQRMPSGEIPDATYYTLAQLRTMTDNWSEKNIIGTGGFGNVYKGFTNGIPVAVKRLIMDPKAKDANLSVKEFLNEVHVLSKVRHRNLVSLRGYCHGKGMRVLVMDFINNGSLSEHLFEQEGRVKRPPLSWEARRKILLTTAQGLHYLHSCNAEKIVHRDVKSSNILLDDTFNAYVCDFGLARLEQHASKSMTVTSMATNHIIGTHGYMAPEWILRGIVSEKMDVFSYGVVLLEVLTGRDRFAVHGFGEAIGDKPTSQEAAWLVCTTRPDLLPQLLDPTIRDEAPEEDAMLLLRLALYCLHAERRQRPSMERVVSMLQGDVEALPFPGQGEVWIWKGSETSFAPFSEDSFENSMSIITEDMSSIAIGSSYASHS